MDTDELVTRLLAGERRAIARLLTHVEDGAPERLREVVKALHPHTGGAHLIGITGSPGVGKSTITNALVAEWRRRDKRVAVLAVDPSSPFSGGALLGDRVRMQDHVLDQGVFIRSMASRGHLGGLSWATPQAVLVLDAAGYDVVIIETVGVGQAEVEIASTADTSIVAIAPGMGDAIQAAKAGILEIADVFCVNKADREGADRTVRELRDMQRLGHDLGSDARPAEIVKTVAAKDEGIDQLADAVEGHFASLSGSGLLHQRRLARARVHVREIALGQVRQRFAQLGDGDLVEDLSAAVARRETDPYTAAEQLLASLET